MTDIVLHNYALSPFSEKIRTTLGLKRIAWRSVDVAPLPPRPLLAALTGGYRRIPVLQIGADIFCDTNAILPALERLQPEPSLYPNDCEGLARGMAFAWERAVWIPTIGVLVHYIGDALPPEFIKDRKEGYLGIDISKPAMAPELPHHLQVLHAQYGWLKSALAAARARSHDFLFGPTPSVLDLACWQTTFLLRKNSPPEVDVLAGLQGLEAWYDRLAAIGHGHVTPMTPDEALAAAAAARPAPVTHLRPDGDPGGLKPGAAVVVTPDDNARVPVHGTLVAASDAQVVIHRHDPQAGDLHLHFPRLGFDVLPPDSADQGDQIMTTEANKQLCRDYFTAFLKRDVAWMQKHIAPTFVRHDPGLPFDVRGPAGVAQLHDALMPAFPDMRLPLEDFVAEGEKVLVRLRVQATHTGPYGDMPATGRKIDIGVLDLFQIRDGVLIEHWALLDNLGMLKQLGALPA